MQVGFAIGDIQIDDVGLWKALDAGELNLERLKVVENVFNGNTRKFHGSQQRTRGQNRNVRLGDAVRRRVAQAIDLEVIWDPDIPKWFYTDCNRVQQILLNLISNATRLTLMMIMKVENANGITTIKYNTTTKDRDTYFHAMLNAIFFYNIILQYRIVN